MTSDDLDILLGAARIPEQRRVLGALLATAGRSAWRAWRPPTRGRAPRLPGPELVERVRAPSPALVRAYCRHLQIAADGPRDAPLVPPHLFPQWTFPLAARALRPLHCPLARVLNAGCRLQVNARIPASAPLTVRAQLLNVEDDGQRALLHERITTDTPDAPGALVADLYAVAPTGAARRRDARPASSAADAARVPFSARELGRLRFGPRAGLAYACLSGDFNPVHWARAYARAAGFPTPILHGFALMARAMECLGRAAFGGATERLRLVDVRFKRPLVLGRGIEVGVYRDDTDPRVFYVADAPGVRPYLTGSMGFDESEAIQRETARPGVRPIERDGFVIPDGPMIREARHA
ncbi:MAG TPA: MaoC family dehydratase [Polyangia bacterium]